MPKLFTTHAGSCGLCISHLSRFAGQAAPEHVPKLLTFFASIDRMFEKLLSREGRKWLYGVSLTVIPLLVAYGVINEDAAPLWVALVGSFLAPTLALTHLSPVESGDVPEEL